MMKKVILLALLVLAGRYSFAQEATENYRQFLKDGWNMQSAVTDVTLGGKISTTDFNAASWYKVSVPTTVIAGLLANKVYDFDPFFGRNFEKLNDSRLDKPWWFRKEFKLPAAENGKNVVLKLQGINYKANVWFNGKLSIEAYHI